MAVEENRFRSGTLQGFEIVVKIPGVEYALDEETQFVLT